MSADPGFLTLFQFYSEKNRFYRVTANAWRRSMNHKSINRHKEFEKYLERIRLDDASSDLRRFFVAPSMLPILETTYWANQKRLSIVNKQKFLNKMFRELESHSGFVEAKKINPKLKMVIGVGNFAFSKKASMHIKGLRTAGLKTLLKQIQKRYITISVPESWTTKVCILFYLPKKKKTNTNKNKLK